MAARTSHGRTAMAAAVAVLVLALAGCADSTVPVGEPPADPRCDAYGQYGDLQGTTVSVLAPIADPEDRSHVDASALFEECTGATVEYEGSESDDVESTLLERLSGGDPPDIAFLPRPGLLATLVRDTGAVVPAPAPVAVNVDQYFPPTFGEAGSVDGTLYAAPLGANVESYVWYSPAAFTEHGYPVPASWDELIDLSNRIVADGGVPWCAGTAPAGSTGGPLTDFLEDAMLRENGPDVYDQWVAHDIAFDAPEVVDALDRVGTLLKDPAFVNGGFGDVASIATTSADEAGLPLLDGTCFLHRQADSYAANWPEGTDVSENGEVFAFLLPQVDPADPATVLVGGEFVAAFTDRPEVAAFQAFLSSPEWADEKAGATTALGRSGWLSANSGLDPALLEHPLDRRSVEILQNPEAEFRFDGSDLMPADVGAGSFPEAMAAWITGTSSQDALTAVEASWPPSEG